MKNSIFILLAFSLLLPIADAAVNVGVSVNTADFSFLGGYGSWVSVGTYGQVWRPRVVSTWRPFTNGEWIMTADGWTWASYESFGWATHHYGNWFYDPVQGWVWIPGYEYAPARVSWIYYGNNVGWAPLPPRGVTLVDPWVTSRVRYWNVVGINNFTNDNVIRFAINIGTVRPHANIRIVRTAPLVVDVERVIKRKVNVVNVRKVDVKGGAHVFRRVEYPDTVNKRISVHRTRVEKEVVVAKKDDKKVVAAKKTETTVKAGKKTKEKEKTTVKKTKKGQKGKDKKPNDKPKQ